MNSYQIFRSFLILLNNFNRPFLLYLVILMQDLNHGGPDDITTPEGTDLNSLTAVHGLQQLILEPTHLLPNSLSCNDIIFTNQTNLEVDSAVHPSSHL